MGGLTVSDIILYAHPTFGVFGILAGVWVFVEALNASAANARRLWIASLACTLFITASWILGGYWYVNYYYAEKAAILKGPWPWAHSIVMETKEHLFFIPLVLALYLPFVTRSNVVRSKPTRAMAMLVAFLIVGSSLVIEGAGALINGGAKVAFIHSSVKGAEK
jgi:hypothetical protein